MSWADEMAGEEEVEAPPLKYTRLDHFVEQYLVHVYARTVATKDTKGVRWCAEWWRHAEAIARLEAIWRAWESARQDPAEGASNWWLSHADPHMRVLFSEDGPFKFCKDGHEPRMVPLLSTAAPVGMFDVDDEG